MSLFQHIPHPRIAQRRTTGPTMTSDMRMRGKGPFGRFNARFGLGVTVVVGTMWCAYLFAALAFVSFPTAIRSGDKLIIVAWIAQTFLQLVLLPVIIVGQNVQAATSDRRATDTFRDAEALLHEAAQLQAHLAAQDAALERILEHLGFPPAPAGGVPA